MWHLIFLFISEVTSCDVGNITWTVVNTTSGRVAAEFRLMPRSCGHECYRLRLFVDEEATNAQECYNVTKFNLLHSTKYVKILEHETINATEVQNIGKVSACGRVCFFL